MSSPKLPFSCCPGAVSRIFRAPACVLVALLLLMHALAFAGPDARFVAVSEAFEAVGSIDGRQLTLWLDRFDDNAPVPGATIELDFNGQRLIAAPDGDRYRAMLPEGLSPGAVPLLIAVQAGAEADLLAARFESVAAALPAVALAPQQAGLSARDGLLLAIGALIGASVGASIAFLVAVRRRAR